MKTKNAKRNSKKSVYKVYAPKNHWRKAFLSIYRRTGVIATSAEHVGVTRGAVHVAMQRDPAFAEECRQAAEEATEYLEFVANQRATEGEKPSDILLMFLLKARKPEKYRDNYRLEMSGPGGGAIPIQSDGEMRVIVLPSNGFENGQSLENREKRLEALTFDDVKGTNGEPETNGRHDANA